MLKLFELEKNLAQVATQLRFGFADLISRLGQEGFSAASMVDIEGVDVEAVANAR